jgi:hypothetical protein
MLLRRIRRRDLVQLWSRAAGLCSHPDCRQRLVLDATPGDEAASIGEAAHIVAHSGAGPRGSSEPPDDLDSYPNLILLCANHHSTVDAQPETYTVETLRIWKAEHEAWIETVTTGVPTRAPWIVVVQEDRRWIYSPEVVSALAPLGTVGASLDLMSDVANNSWELAAARQRRELDALLLATPPQRRRFAIFSLARIPLAVHLGYVLGDRTRVELFQYDRDRGAWSWDDDARPEGPVSWTASDCPEGRRDHAAIRVSLSAPVDPHPAHRAAFEIDIRVPAPSVRWLRAPSQLAELSRVYEAALAAVRARRCTRVHLYYAGPAPGAIALGRAYNPAMNPPLSLYEYSRHAYDRVLTINRHNPIPKIL